MSESPTMRAVHLVAPREPLQLRAVAIPEPGAGEIRLKVAACGVCRTELHLIDGGLDLGARDFTIGHEIAGTIEAVGAGVDPARIGEACVLYYYQGCGACRYCRAGEANLCPQPIRQPGFTSDGGYADYIVAPAGNAVPLGPDADLAEAAPLGCAGSTGVHACRLADVQAGEWVVVNGAGGVGLAAAQVALAAGARVVAIDVDPEKLALATAMGAEAAIDASREDVAARIAALTGEGADVVFELVGRATTMRLATAILRRRGRLVLIGYTGDTYETHPTDLIVREIRVIGSVGATLQDLHDAVDLYRRGRLSVPVARRLPLEAFQEALDLTARGALHGRAVLMP